VIDLPEKVIDEAFDRNICQGAVIYYVKLALTVETKNKFLVVLNHNCRRPDIYCFLTTSQTKFYESHRKLRNYFVFIPENMVLSFRWSRSSIAEIHTQSAEISSEKNMAITN